MPIGSARGGIIAAGSSIAEKGALTAQEETALETWANEVYAITV